MANINKIRISGSTYNIEDSSATKTVKLTQAQYNQLSPKDPNTFYIITDAEYFDPSGYVTSAQTESAITAAVSGKQDTLISGTNIKTINNESILGSGNITIQGGGGGIDSGTVQTMIDESISGKTNQTDFVSHSGNTSIHVTAQDKTNWNNKSDFSGNYNDLSNKLSAGTNITIVDNVISAEGGGKAVSAGRGISVTTGETADTVSFNLALSAGTRTDSIIGGRSGNSATPQASFAFGENNIISYDCAYASIFGYNNKTYNGSTGAHIVGVFNEAKNGAECAVGKNNVSNTGSTTADKTLFSVGNGTADNARHNAFEIRQNGDIYLNDGSKLQDTVSATTANTTALGGLKLVKLSQSEYDSLATKDNSTLYVIVN